jgi:hypothetical protein
MNDPVDMPIEIKATIPHHQIDTALEHYTLSIDNDEERTLYFFDTPDLDLSRPG